MDRLKIWLRLVKRKIKKRYHLDDDAMAHIAKFMILPMIALVLTVFVIISNGINKYRTVAASRAATTTDEQTTPPMTAATIATNPDEATLETNTIEAIDTLVQNYLDARINADAQLMYEVFGRSDSEGQEDLQARLAQEQLIYEGFEETTIYTLDGLDENSKIVYIYSYIKFYDVVTTAPILVKAYATMNDNGSYHFIQTSEYTQQIAQLVYDSTALTSVKALDQQMRDELTYAVTTDAKLGGIYEVIVSGNDLEQINNSSMLESMLQATQSYSVEEVTVEVEDTSSTDDSTISLEDSVDDGEIDASN